MRDVTVDMLRTIFAVFKRATHNVEQANTHETSGQCRWRKFVEIVQSSYFDWNLANQKRPSVSPHNRGNQLGGKITSLGLFGGDHESSLNNPDSLSLPGFSSSFVHYMLISLLLLVQYVFRRYE